MRRTVSLFAALLIPAAFASAAVAAETKVTLEKTHLCCNSCVKGAEKAVATVKGAAVKCDRDAGTVTITAPDAESAQKAVDALVEAGFYGKAEGATLKNDSGAPDGKVKSATVSGIHNCCKKCTTTINDTIKKVDGAKATVEPKAETFTVTGDFDAKDLVKALNDAGFHVKVEAK